METKTITSSPIYFITPQEVQNIAFSSSEQLRDDLVSESKILIAQERYIKPALGKLMDHLQEVQYTTFVNNYLKAPLAFYVRSLVIDDLAVSIGNMGAMQINTNTCMVAPPMVQSKLRRQALLDANTLMERLVSYIEANIELFPLYDPSTNVLNQLSLRGGIVL